MIANLAVSLSYILTDEGPELNVGPSEPGGASKYGVSVALLTDWRKRNGQSVATVKDVGAVTPQFANQVYTDMYATPIRFGDIPSGLDYRMLDICVNLGLHGGVSLTQSVFGVWQGTGAMDQATLDAMRAVDVRSAIQMLGAGWIAKKHEALSWSTYGHGWTKRYLAANQRALNLL